MCTCDRSILVLNVFVLILLPYIALISARQMTLLGFLACHLLLWRVFTLVSRVSLDWDL